MKKSFVLQKSRYRCEVTSHKMTSPLSERAFNYYRYYLAIKLHFNTDSFDFFKNNGKTRTSIQAFNGRNDRYFFEKMAKVIDTGKFLDKCLTEVKQSKKFSSRDIFTPDNERRYLKRKGYLESFPQALEREVSEVVNYCLKNGITKSQLVEGSEDKKPVIYVLLKKGTISDETYLAFDKVYDVSAALAKFSLDPLVVETETFLKNYYPFVSKYFPRKEDLVNKIKKTLAILQE